MDCPECDGTGRSQDFSSEYCSNCDGEGQIPEDDDWTYEDGVLQR